MAKTWLSRRALYAKSGAFIFMGVLAFVSTGVCAPARADEKKEKKECVDNYWADPGNALDVYSGGGYFDATNENFDSIGRYYWAKGRFRPVCVTIGEWTIRLGAMGYAATGGGKVDRSSYKWDKAAVGPSVSVSHGKGEQTQERYVTPYTIDIDVGIGKSWAHSRNGMWQGRQYDGITYTAVHFDKAHLEGEKGSNFKTGYDVAFEFEYSEPWDPSSKATWDDQPTGALIGNKRSIDGMLSAGGFSWAPFGGEFSVIPRVNVGSGRQWESDWSYFHVGPGLLFRYGEYNLFNVNVANWRKHFEGKDNSMRWADVSFDLGSMYCALSGSLGNGCD